MSKTNDTKTKWYLIDQHILGKVDMHGCFIFNNRHWEADKNNLIMDCIFGYDATEEGPYVLGNNEMLYRIKEITELEAFAIIKKS